MSKQSDANLGFEKKLWAIADKLRGNMDPSEYKHVVLGLIFLKYISDAFDYRRQEIQNDPELGEDFLEDKDAYTMENIFWVPAEARWENLQNNAKKPEIGILIDKAMLAIEKENKPLKGVLPKNYARPELNKQRLGEIIDIFSSLPLKDKNNQSRDLLGRVYEYFISQFANAEGKRGGEFYTPACIVRLLVQMLEPHQGRIYDPCCGSGGMFVQSQKFVQEVGGKLDDVAIYGQESNANTWKLCRMNLTIRGIGANLGEVPADSFHNDQHQDLKADFILANPPFNDSDWGQERLKNDPRWQYGLPPNGNANYAWIQHFIYHLKPTGIAGFVMANGALSSNTAGEGEIRKNLIKANLVDCIIALPDKLFYTTAIPASLWFVSRNRHNHKFRDRHQEILFIDARNLGQMIDRRHRELTPEEINQVADTYHHWRNKNDHYEDILGFCKAAPLEEVKKNNYVLTPGRYVGTKVEMEDDEVFEAKMARLTKELSQQFADSKKLEKQIKENLKKVGFKI